MVAVPFLHRSPNPVQNPQKQRLRLSSQQNNT